MSKAIFVAGLAYGDEGKGATVDFLCRQLPVDLIVRYNGGSQAAHNVVTPEGVHHTFSQFGSGMLANNKVRTYLSRFMLIDPLSMKNEGDALASKTLQPWLRTTVDPRCVVITPFHKQVNRLREQDRGQARHGSCGMGVGVAREWHLAYGDAVLLVDDLRDHTRTCKKLNWLWGLAAKEFGIERIGDVDIFNLADDYFNWAWYHVGIQKSLPITELAVFEGAQGVLLDETHGIEPHRTWTDCTFNNADALCWEAGIAERFRIGCLRTYFTRHGAGPLRNEFQLALGPEVHNKYGQWQEDFRTAVFDHIALGNSLSVLGHIDCLALSHLDILSSPLRGTIANLVGIKAHGPTASDREFTPAWTEAWTKKLVTA